MFLRPQHFQQQDRYIESLLRQRSALARPNGWGVAELVIDRDLLKTGKFAIARCSGVMPDGTQFNVPDEADAPLALDLNEEVMDSTVYLALPIEDSRGLEADLQQNGNGSVRYHVEDSEVHDSTNGTDTPVSIQVGRLQLRLMLESEERGGFHCIGLGRVVQVSAEGVIVTDEDFMPSCVDYHAASRLSAFVRELEGLLHQRGESLAGRVAQSGQADAAQIADFLLLQAVNRYEPLVAQLAPSTGVHPEDLYRFLISLAGELATFSTTEKRPPEFPPYRQDSLRETFEPVMASLRQSLSMVFERSAIAIPLEERRYGIMVATIADKMLLDSAQFVLAVNADIPAETLRGGFPQQIKIGPVEKIRDLVNHALPGLGLQAMPVAPRQIPFHTGVTYFALDTKSPLWTELKSSGGLAMHVGGNFPGLNMALWAIRQ